MLHNIKLISESVFGKEENMLFEWRLTIKKKNQQLSPDFISIGTFYKISINTRISAGTEKHSMGGGVWEQTNLGGVKL